MSETNKKARNLRGANTQIHSLPPAAFCTFLLTSHLQPLISHTFSRIISFLLPPHHSKTIPSRAIFFFQPITTIYLFDAVSKADRQNGSIVSKAHLSQAKSCSRSTQFCPWIPSHGSQPRPQEGQRIILGWQDLTERPPCRREASPWRTLENTERSRHRQYSQQ